MLIKTALYHGNFIGSLFAAILMIFAISGCGGGGGGSSTADPTPTPDPYPAPDPEPTPTLYATAPTSASTSLGQIWVNGDGLSLYTFENDRNDSDGDGLGDSDCNASCAQTWPPMLATASAQGSGDFSIITRDDGTARQWAFAGLPLYMYIGDSVAGDVNGEGIDNLWYVARPDPVKKEASSNPATGIILVSTYSQITTDGGGAMGTSRITRDGFTLYTFEGDRNDIDSDGSGDSDCNTECAETWPPLFADKGANARGDYSIIDRDDGSMQWALNGLPLYFYMGDLAAGETLGDGVNELWYIARPTPFATALSSIGGRLIAVTPVHEVDETGAMDPTTRAHQDFSLYVFDEDIMDNDGDGAGDSDCHDACAVVWPPFYADLGAVAKDQYSIILRDDGSRQWAFKGEPLYFYAGDSAPVDVNGDQVDNTWHLARPAPVQIFADDTLGDIFAARGVILDVDSNGNPANTSSDKTGFTLYRFDQDTSNDSNCDDSCAVIWPPLYAASADLGGGDFSIISRGDSSLQWAYKGAPLYFYYQDTAPGMVTGVYPDWHEVTP